MTEGILIEIAQRFRKLEDLCGSALGHVKQTEQRTDNQISKWHKENGDKETVSNFAMRELASLEKQSERAQELQSDLDSATEACRDDMNAMMDQIRNGLL